MSRYADRAKKIKNKAVVNENPMDKLIRELKEENEKLKLAMAGGDFSALMTMPGGDGGGGGGGGAVMTEEGKNTCFFVIYKKQLLLLEIDAICFRVKVWQLT